jgi:hippurate hydrolase
LTVNHHDETEIALSAMRAVAGAGRVDDTLKPVMGSEDFAFVLRQVPGAYIFLGNGDTAALHNPAYDFTDQAIPHGVAYWVELAHRVLPG